MLYEVGTAACVDGVSAFSDHTGAFTAEVVELIDVGASTNTAITIGP